MVSQRTEQVQAAIHEDGEGFSVADVAFSYPKELPDGSVVGVTRMGVVPLRLGNGRRLREEGYLPEESGNAGSTARRGLSSIARARRRRRRRNA